MSARTVYKLAIDGAVAATTATVDIRNWTDVMVVMKYTYDAVDSAGAMVVYGSMDAGGTNKMAVGIKPILTGTRDADGSIALGAADQLVAYEVPGNFPYIHVAITVSVAIVTTSVWIVGKEER